MAERFELEVVTIFQEQGLEAAVQRMQAQLRAISAAAVPTGGAGGAGASDISPQIQQLATAQRALEQAARQSQRYTTTQINEARSLLQAEANTLSQANAVFQQAMAGSRARGAVLLDPRPTQVAGGTQVLGNGSVNGGLGNPRGSASDIADQARNLDEERLEGDLAQASAQLARARRELAADIVRLQAIDRDYISATARLADARESIAAQAVAQRAPGIAADRRAANRLFGAQAGAQANARLIEPQNVDVLAENSNSQARLSAAVREAADREGELTAVTARLQQLRVSLAEGVQRSLAADRDYLQSTVRLAVSRDQLAAAELRATGGNAAAMGAAVDRAVERRFNANNQAAAVAIETVQSERVLDSEIDRAAAIRARRNAVQEGLAQRDLVETGGAPLRGGGTAFQRMQANFAQRSGQGPADPQRFQTLGQYVGTRAVTTAAYGLSGAVIYGGVTAIQSMVEQTENLQERFALLQNQFEQTNRAGALPEYRRAILDIARETGITADVVADVGYQMAGAFDNTIEAADNLRAAMQLSRVSGLEVEDVTNDLTAATATWGMTSREIGDVLVGVERRYGLEVAQSIDIVGQMSNTAAQAGLTFEEMGEMIGAVGRVSGRSSNAIAESFNRILPSISGSASQINEVYAQAMQGGQIDTAAADEMLQSLAQGDTGVALMQILRDWDRFQGPMQDQLIEILGGQRESQTVIPLVQERRRVTEGAARRPGADANALETRFNTLQQTLGQRLAQLGERFRQLGMQLGEAGLLDAMGGLALGLLTILDAISRLLSGFNWLDDHLGNLPSRLIAVVIALRLLQAVWRGFQGLRGEAQNIFTNGIFNRRNQQAAQDAAQVGQSAGRTGPPPVLVSPNAPRNVVGPTQPIRPIGPLPVLVSPNDLRNLAGPSRDVPARAVRESVFVAGAGGVQETRRVVQETASATAAATAAAASGRTMGQRVGQAFTTTSTNIVTALQNAWLRARGQIARLGQINAASPLPGVPGRLLGAEGSRRQRISGFLTGGAAGGLGGGLAAFGGIAAAGGAVLALAETIQDTRQQLGQQQRGIRDQLAGRSVQELRQLRGQNRDNWATNIGSRLGLTQSVGRTFNTAIQQSSVREFEIAVEQGFMGQDPELKNVLQELKQNQGRGRAGEAARTRLDQLSAEQQQTVRELMASGHTAEMTGQTQGQSDIDAMTAAAGSFDIGALPWDQYIAQTRAAVERLRVQALGRNPQAIANYQQGLQHMNQALDQNMQTRMQLIEGAVGAATTPDETAAILNRSAQQLDAGRIDTRQRIADNFIGRIDPATQVRVSEARGAAPTQDTAKARLAQLTEARDRRQQAFEQATANVTDPARIEELRKLFQMSPENMAEIQSLQMYLFQQIFDMGGITTQASQLQQAAQNLFSLQQAQAQTQIAGLYDPAAIARVQAGVAQNQMTAAQAVTDPDERAAAVENARTAAVQASRQAQDVQDRVAQSRLALIGTRTGRDPLRNAQNQIDQGRLALRQARGDEAATNAAMQQIEQGQQAMEEAQTGIARARIGLFRAQHPEDVIAAAQADQREADLAVRNAHGEAARLDALAQRVQADRAMQDALRDVFNSQSELLEAQFSASGELALAAQEGVNRAQRALDDARARGAAAEVINRLEAEAVTARDRLGDQQEADMRDMIDFDLQMGYIGRDAAIARYRAMLPLLDPREQRDMLLAIQRLEQEAAGGAEGLQFNLPTTLGLPTLYTARRMAQETMGDTRMYASGGVGVAPTTNNDNRVVTITLNTDSGFDGNAAVQTIVSALNEAPRYGAQPRLY